MLRPYNPGDFDVLNTWIPDAEALLRFSGPDWPFPLSAEVLNKHVEQHPHRWFYMACHENGMPYGFGQIIANEANAPRLGRLLVDPAQRGKGLGLQFVLELIEQCKIIAPSNEIYLFVDEANTAALRCYEKAGFKLDKDISHPMKAGDTIITIKRMTLHINTAITA